MPPELAAADLARHKAEEHRIGRLQEYLKQIVYGGNDGIVTTFSVVAGFAGFGAEGAATVGGIALACGSGAVLADLVTGRAPAIDARPLGLVNYSAAAASLTPNAKEAHA